MTETLPLIGLVAAALLILLFLRRRSEVRPSSPPRPVQAQGPAPLQPPAPSFDPTGATAGFRRVRITHPLVQKAARRAAAGQTDAAKLVVTDGREMFFVLDAIGDEAERRRAYELLTSFQAGEGADLNEVLALLRRLGGD